MDEWRHEVNRARSRDAAFRGDGPIVADACPMRRTRRLFSGGQQRPVRRIGYIVEGIESPVGPRNTHRSRPFDPACGNHGCVHHRRLGSP